MALELVHSATAPQAATDEPEIAIPVEALSVRYGTKPALKDVSLNIAKQRVMAFIGPSGCGKSTLLRWFNRMNDLVPGVHIESTIEIDGEDITGEDVEVTQLRTGGHGLPKVEPVSHVDL